MKTKLLTTTFIMVLAINGFTQTAPLPNVQAPRELMSGEFQEGTLTQLSKAEVEQFLPWAQNAKNVLTKAMKDSKTMPVKERLPYIESTIKSVVLNSGTKNYQMFMRFALNRGLLLAGEIKNEANVEDIGIKENILDILVKSIEVAMTFYESDLEFQKRAQSGNTSMTQEYATFGVSYAEAVLPSVQNILDASAEYKLLYKTFEMVNWDLSKDSKALDYSDTITEIFQKLQSISETPSQDDEENLKHIRKLMILKNGVDKLKIEPRKQTEIKEPCGLVGSIFERIRDCSYPTTSNKAGWVLVTRTKDFKETYKDIKTGIIWGDIIIDSTYWRHGRDTCKEIPAINGSPWRLPHKEEYETAEKNGIRKALPNMHKNYWTLTDNYEYHYNPWYFHGTSGTLGSIYRNNVN